MVLDEFGREVSAGGAGGGGSGGLPARRELTGEERRALKPWELPDAAELAAEEAARTAAAASTEHLSPEEAAMAAMLGFSEFGSTKGTHVEDNSTSAAKGTVRRVTVKKYRQYVRSSLPAPINTARAASPPLSLHDSHTTATRRWTNAHTFPHAPLSSPP